MTDIGMIAFDLDGTALTEEKILTSRTHKILESASESGILLVPTTGRSLSGIPDVVKALSGADYVITANGAGVYRRCAGFSYTATDKLSANDPGFSSAAPDMPPTYDIDSSACYELEFENLMDTGLVIRLMNELSGLSIMPDPFIEGACYIYADRVHLIDRMDVTDQMKAYIRTSRIPIADMPAFLADKKIQKITINFIPDGNGHRTDYDKTVEILKKYPEFTAVTGGINNLEISDKKATKGDAMMRLADKLGIGRDQIIAFGDSENDNTMLKMAGTGVAMANALESAKAAANAVTLSNDDEGLADFLEKLL
ncbi:MAG: HAD hydrolase family protein [Eubacterium sp.]|nr:HAD hydrolase family protein [Eubacterium sp.]